MRRIAEFTAGHVLFSILFLTGLFFLVRMIIDGVVGDVIGMIVLFAGAYKLGVYSKRHDTDL